jgi:hypothetical protein
MSFSHRFFGILRGDENVAAMLSALVLLIIEVLGQYPHYFEPGKFPPNLIFVSALGKMKLKEEYPGVWTEFNLG